MGSPVEPEVKMTVAVASSEVAAEPGKNAPSAAIGTSCATAAAQSLSAGLTCAGMSSRNTSVPLGVILNLSRTLPRSGRA